MQVQFYDFRWKEADRWVLQAIAQGKIGRREIAYGDPLSIRVVSEPRCRGVITNQQWLACSTASVGSGQCPTCRRLQKDSIFTIFDGFSAENYTPQELDKLRVPHLVYLAWFAPQVIKVGVSQAARKSLRQWEQGSAGTLFIANCPDGIMARQIETLTNQQGLRDKIRLSQKKDWLTQTPAADEIESDLREIAKNIPNYVSHFPALVECCAAQPEFHYWLQDYHLPTKFSAENLSLGVEESVSGKVAFVRGSFIGLEVEQELIILNAKDWTGRELDFQNIPEGLTLKSSRQSSLF